MREAFEVEIPLRRLFEVPTVAGLAESIEAARQAGQNSLAPPILPVPRNEDLVLSFAQQRLWFFDQLEPGLVSLQHSGRRPSQGAAQPGGAGAEPK